MAVTPEVGKAQSAPLADELRTHFKKESLSVGALLQVVADYQSERSFAGESGFSIANFRVSLSGRLDEGFAYFLQTNFTASPAILDAVLRYQVASSLALDAGAFKAPFSHELLTSAANIDFVNRSQVVTALAPGRQIGVQLRGRFADRRLGWSGGAFNGNGVSRNGNDGDNVLWVGRLDADAASSAPEPVRFQGGVNVAFGTDTNAPLGGGFVPSFSGDRLIVGGDARVTKGAWLFAGEAIWSQLDFDASSTREPFGLAATAGYWLTSTSTLLFRWDRFLPDGVASDADLLLFGYNLFPSTLTELQINYVVPARQTRANHQLLLNLQVSL